MAVFEIKRELLAWFGLSFSGKLQNKQDGSQIRSGMTLRGASMESAYGTRQARQDCSAPLARTRRGLAITLADFVSARRRTKSIRFLNCHMIKRDDSHHCVKYSRALPAFS